jgi:nitrite reductase/ring-hydroxylating ferredoxin subunit
VTENGAAHPDNTRRICPTAVPERHLVGCRIDGFWLVLGRIGMNLFAYREICPGCGSSLVQSPVSGGVVTCAICQHRYDLARGGCSVDQDGRRLEAVPILGGPIGPSV